MPINYNTDIDVKNSVCKEKEGITLFHNIIGSVMKRLEFVCDRMLYLYVVLLRGLGCDMTLLHAQVPDKVKLDDSR